MRSELYPAFLQTLDVTNLAIFNMVFQYCFILPELFGNARFSDSPWDLEAKPWDRELIPQTVSLTVKPWELAGLVSRGVQGHAPQEILYFGNAIFSILRGKSMWFNCCKFKSIFCIKKNNYHDDNVATGGHPENWSICCCERLTIGTCNL